MRRRFEVCEGMKVWRMKRRWEEREKNSVLHLSSLFAGRDEESEGG